MTKSWDECRCAGGAGSREGVRWAAGRQLPRLHPEARRTALRDRPQRRRQEHALQTPHRPTQPTAGTIHFKGLDVTRLLPHEIARAGIGIKFQVPRVYDSLPVAENLWLSARSRHGAAGAGAIVDRVLSEVGLVERRASPVGHLSHGDLQWVEIGMVLTSHQDL